MENSTFSALKHDLVEREQQGLLRQRRTIDGPQQPRLLVDGQVVLSFCSNDYLGLASHPQLVAALQRAASVAGVGSGASHLITGHHRLHHELEQALASFVGLPRALLFTTGYMANLGIVPALVQRHDDVFADRLNHASLNDAVVLSRATLHRYPHNDMAALEKLLASSNATRKLVIADAVFSMDGDIAHVPQLLALCERYDAWLLLDDAHGFGILGAHGKGVLEHFHLQSSRIIYMATLGKAAGVSGAFVAGDAVLVKHLLQHARTYIYTTAMPAPLAGALLASLQLIEQESWRRTQLAKLVTQLREAVKFQRWHLAESSSAIQPVIIGSNDEALAASKTLLRHGILVPAIRPPTVPKGTARLRITLSAAHTSADIEQLATALQAAEAATLS